jgi:TraY domain
MGSPENRRKVARPRGRPPLPQAEGKRHALALRVTAERRNALEEAAAQSGRSLSQEIEFRLEQSFHEEASYGGREMAGLFRMMAGAAAFISERRGGKAWSSDWETFQAVRTAWRELINQAIPSMPADWKAKFQNLKSEDPGRPPALPELGNESLGLLSDMFASDSAFSQEREHAIEEWRRNVEDWENRVRNYREKLDEFKRHFEEIENLGREVGRSPLGRALMPISDEDQ